MKPSQLLLSEMTNNSLAPASMSSSTSTLSTTPEDTPDDNLEDTITRDEQVRELARSLTAQSELHPGLHHNPFHAEIGSSLDPNSESFRPRDWAKALVSLKSEDPAGHPQRTAGIAFQDLNVHGFGKPTDYQKTVGNVWLQTADLVRKITGTGKIRKIEILDDFDGLVRSGEMLVVLGPPGSGCSTLLKTIAGETHGIEVAPGSELNYQGNCLYIVAKKSPLTLCRHQFRTYAIPISRRGHLHS